MPVVDLPMGWSCTSEPAAGARVKGGRSPAQRTLEARGRGDKLDCWPDAALFRIRPCRARRQVRAAPWSKRYELGFTRLDLLSDGPHEAGQLTGDGDHDLVAV